MAVWILVALIAVCGFFGWRAGVLKRLVQLVGLVVSILAAARLASLVAPWLDGHTVMGATTSLVLAFILILVVGLVVTELLARWLQKMLNLSILGGIDHAGGLICGLLLGTLLASVCLIGLCQVPGGGGVRTTFTTHPVGRVIYRAAPDLYLGARRVTGGRGDALWQMIVDRSREAVEDARDRANTPRP
jgi:hypothetical protein